MTSENETLADIVAEMRTECGLSTRYYDDPARAAEAWNRRAAQ